MVFCLVGFLVAPLGAQETNQSSSTKDQQATPTDAKPPHEQVRDMGLFRPLWYGEALNLNYLLEELNIVGYQCAELKRIAARTRKESEAFAVEFHNEQAKRGEMFSMFDDPVWMEKQLSIQKKLVVGSFNGPCVSRYDMPCNTPCRSATSSTTSNPADANICRIRSDVGKR